MCFDNMFINNYHNYQLNMWLHLIIDQCVLGNY